MLLDLMLGSLLLLSALLSLHSRNSLKSGIFFVVFGLLSGLLWVRLEAPDVAMVEIVLGSAVTSLLIFKLIATARIKAVKVHRIRKFWAGVISLAFLVYMIPYLLTLRKEQRIEVLVFEKLSMSGVESPVTAVLLNFRGYDTLLEVGVITLAVFGIIALNKGDKVYVWRDPLVQSLSRWILPMTVFFSFYVTYLGTFSVGGAFQGGSLLAGGLIFLSLTGQDVHIGESIKKFLLLLSLLVFCGVGLMYAVTGYGFLVYPLPLSTISIILIELSICLSTALLLYTAYRGKV